MPATDPGKTGWDDVANAAQRLCLHYRIDQQLWGRACQLMGRNIAAIAVIRMDAVEPRNPGGYLNTLINKAEAGELRLNHSIIGLIQGNNR